MTQCVGIGCLQHRPGIRVDDDGRDRRIVAAVRGGDAMMAAVVSFGFAGNGGRQNKSG
jgi:hypothetical protein